MKKVNRQEKTCIIFRHNDFSDEEIYCAERYAKVVAEGNEADLFVDNVVEGEIVEDGGSANANEVQGVPGIFNSDLAENIARLRAEGYDVDDDNEPAPENIPFANGSQGAAPEDTIFQEWDSTTICNRLEQGLRHENAQLTTAMVPTVN